MTAETRLAVYGTLAPGEANHHQLLGLRGEWSGGAVFGRRYHSGSGAALGYPGLVLDPRGPAVSVQVFTSDDLPAHWNRLDEFEGAGYLRVTTDVVSGDAVVEACIYVLAPGAVPGAGSGD